MPRTAFDKYDARALTEALEDAFESFGMWDAYGDWQRVKGVILAEWKRSGGGRRHGFDKRNVPTLLSALESVLTKNGLGKSLTALDRVKRDILKEWKDVGVDAFRENKRDRKTKSPFKHYQGESPRERAQRLEQVEVRGASMRHPMDIYSESLKTAEDKVASNTIINKIFDIKKWRELVRKMGDDQQSIELLEDITTKFYDRLSLSGNEDRALGRMLNGLESVSRWDEATHRNNIFKAADLLGIKLPSGMFASEEKTASVIGPYANVGTRAVTFWTLVPISGIRDGQSHKVIKNIQEADKALEAEVRKSLHSTLPAARDLGNSVQMGHLVEPDKSGKSLVVYTQFWKEGRDRNTSDIYEMQEFLKGSGTKLSPPPVKLDD